MLTKLNGYKTYIVCAGSILYALLSVWQKQMDWNAASQMIQVALTGAGLRHGVANL